MKEDWEYLYETHFKYKASIRKEYLDKDDRKISNAVQGSLYTQNSSDYLHQRI